MNRIPRGPDRSKVEHVQGGALTPKARRVRWLVRVIVGIAALAALWMLALVALSIFGGC